MGTEPLKKELESIDQELEVAMSQLSETTRRVDEILMGFNADDVAPRPPAQKVEAFEPPDAPDEPDDE